MKTAYDRILSPRQFVLLSLSISLFSILLSTLTYRDMTQVNQPEVTPVGDFITPAENIAVIGETDS